jgi:cytochrome c-type biogenesis protein CcmE
MTVAAPPEPILPPRRRPWGIVVLVVVVLLVVGYLAFSSIGSALVYYRTPTEVAAQGDDAIGVTIRLGGLVLEGSVEGDATDPDGLRFTLTDGDTEIPVMTTIAPTRSFREGSGAVVQGALGADGVFVADQVIVKHDENYVAPSDGAAPSGQVFDPGSE